MNSRRTNNIETLSEQLESLRITEEASSEDKQTNTGMSTAPVVNNENVQTEMPRNIVLDLGWFNSD